MKFLGHRPVQKSALALCTLAMAACSVGRTHQPGNQAGRSAEDALAIEASRKNESVDAAQRRLDNLKGGTLAERESALSTARTALADAENPSEIEALKKKLAELEGQIADLKLSAAEREKLIARLSGELSALREDTKNIEAKILEKIRQGGLVDTNLDIIRESFEGHTEVYALKGKYNVMVIPVEFASEEGFDGSLRNRDSYVSGQAQKALFGGGPGSLSTYYKHTSGGRLDVSGEVVAPIKVDNPLSFYGEAVTGSNDKNARQLVVDALKQVRARVGDNKDWWRQFDRWDLGDYDGDKHFYERDGFIDAVILVYAGKEQSACQRPFDPEGKKPASADIPADDPRRASKIECFNRIWPHRWSVFLPADNPDAPKTGPRVEGQERPAIGMKITDDVYAFDYNMQSEYSDVSTFIHEFGHSLTLPDTYAYQKDNAVQKWDVMAQNASNDAQEMSGYNKLAIGWLAPKTVEQGEATSAYLGASNFVPPEQRAGFDAFTGPKIFKQFIRGAEHLMDIVSTVPETGEAVFKSLLVRAKPTKELIKIVDVPPANGRVVAYSDRYDGRTRSLKLSLKVPETGDASLSFDAFYHIETETNFNSRDPEIKVVTDFDLGFVRVNDEVKEELRLVSGDDNFDSLNESNPECEADTVLALRAKLIDGSISADEKKAFAEKAAVCQAPTWVKKSYDLSVLRGQTVKIEIGLGTDGGYTELGLLVDNLKLGSESFDFEDGAIPGQEFVALTDGLTPKVSNQFYLMEYRDPTESYRLGEGSDALSSNRDRFINSGGVGMFLPEGDGLTPKDRFRVVTTAYQPGLLVWYFNSKFDRQSNNPEIETQPGQGYILPIASAVRPVAMPSVLGDKAILDDKGFYASKSEAFLAAQAKQENELKCFGYTKFAEYLDGKKPECDSYAQKDLMDTLTFNGRQLKFARESYNNSLPKQQRQHWQVGVPLNDAKTSLARQYAPTMTFRTAGMGSFAPFRVYKVDANNALVLDRELSARSERVAPVDTFTDTQASPQAPHLANPLLWGYGAIVQPKGLVMKVVDPAEEVVAQYRGTSAAANDVVFRRPQVKVLINWDESVAARAEENVNVRGFVRSAPAHVHTASCAHDH